MVSRKIFRDVSSLALLIGFILVTGILSQMNYQEPELRMAGEIPEESDVTLLMDPRRLEFANAPQNVKRSDR